MKKSILDLKFNRKINDILNYLHNNTAYHQYTLKDELNIIMLNVCFFGSLASIFVLLVLLGA